MNAAGLKDPRAQPGVLGGAFSDYRAGRGVVANFLAMASNLGSQAIFA